MTNEKVLEVLDYYEKLLSVDVRPLEADSEDYLPEDYEALGHILSMIPKMREFIAEGRKEKAMRWLGFIQGVLWMTGNFGLDDLKNHNRP